MAMTECHRNVLRKARVYLMENMEIKTIMDHLISELVLTASDEDALNTEKTNRTKTKALLETLPRKGDNGYMKLMKVLREHQTFVYDYLHEMEQEIDEQLSAGASLSPTLQVHQPSALIAQPQSSPGPSRRSCYTTDEASMDDTDSGPDRFTATCTTGPTNQISSNVDKGQVIDSDMAPQSSLALVTEQALSILAGKLGAEWEQLAIHMGFQQHNLFHWKQESSTVWGSVFAMLTRWKCQNANNATISQLLAVLQTFQPPLDPSVYSYLYFE